MWIIIGFGIVSLFYIIGMCVGKSIGAAIGVGNVGGVAFGMIGLVILTNTKFWTKYADERVKDGIKAVSSLYLPVVVAMIYKTDVVGAFRTGPVALIIGFIAIFSGLLLVRPIAQLVGKWTDALHTQRGELINHK